MVHRTESSCSCWLERRLPGLEYLKSHAKGKGICYQTSLRPIAKVALNIGGSWSQSSGGIP